MKTILLLLSLLGLIKFADPTCDLDPSSELPAVENNLYDPEVDLSEIDNLYVTNIGNPLTDVTDLAEWTARLSNVASGSASDIRSFPCIGEFPAPDTPVIKISKNRQVNGETPFTVNADIDEMSQKNYDYSRSTYCGKKVLIWYSSGKYMYGGNSGIEAYLIMKPSVSKGKTEANKLSAVANWEAKFPPERTENPLV